LLNTTRPTGLRLQRAPEEDNYDNYTADVLTAAL
jgi:hypothetical protein